tara:strand:- start:4391 stop:6238 length:1848 start_codon:yes stop_codon:yes gene_type:complete
MEEEAGGRGIVDKVLNYLFSLTKTQVWLIVIFILALIVRMMAAFNLGVSADDMHFAPHAINFLGSGKLQTWDQAPLWFAFTDLSYKIFGTTQFASRFAAVIFGALSVLVIFFLAKELVGNRKVALISASLVAFSPFLVKNIMAEMDVMVMFFVLMFLLLFIKGVREEKQWMLVLAMIALGLGALTKHYALLFLPVMWVYYYIKSRKKISKGKILKNLILFGLLFTLIISPMLISNYLTYDSKGFLDFQFTRLLKIGAEASEPYYGWASGFEGGIDLKGFFLGNSINWSPGQPTAIIPLQSFLFADPLVAILGLIGMIYLFRKKRELAWLILGIFVVPWVILGSVNLLDKHFIYLSLLFSIPAGIFVAKIGERFKLRFSHLFIGLLVINLVLLGHPHITSDNFYSNGPENQMIKFKQDNIDPNSLVIVDSRIYRGRNAFNFNDRHYIESATFGDLLANQNQIPGDPVSIKTYFVECVKDDCGWGTIKNQPEFNQTMEQLVKVYSEEGRIVGEISIGPNELNVFGIGQGEKEVYYRIYERNLALSPAFIDYADSTHNVFLYPIGYDRSRGEIFDDYDFSKNGNILLYRLGKLILWVNMVAILIFVLIILGFFVRWRN